MIIRIKTKTTKIVGDEVRPRGFTMLEVAKPEDLTVDETIAVLKARKPEDIEGLPEDVPAEAFLHELKSGHVKVSTHEPPAAETKEAAKKRVASRDKADKTVPRLKKEAAAKKPAK